MVFFYIIFAALSMKEIINSLKSQQILLKICVFLLFLNLSSCKDDPIKYDFQVDTASYFRFKNGSIWIYQNPNNLSDFDTIIGSNAGEGFATRDAGLAEIASITLDGSSSPQVIIRAEAIATSDLDRIAVLTKLNNIFNPGPILLNINGTMNPEDSSVLTKLVSFDVAGTQYQDIWEIKLKKHPYFKTLWFAKNTGIIKKELITGEFFDLISYTPGN